MLHTLTISLLAQQIFYASKLKTIPTLLGTLRVIFAPLSIFQIFIDLSSDIEITDT
jgi:hypothetical protein